MIVSVKGGCGLTDGGGQKGNMWLLYAEALE